MSTNTDNIARRIAPLFGFSTERMLECMTALQQGKSDAFYEELYPLEEENIGERLGGGEFGVVMAHKTNKNRAFKLMYTNPCLLMGMMEAFIQAVLCTEPIIGASICKLFRVYQSPKGLAIEIERLPYTLVNYIKETTKKNGISEMRKLMNGILKEIEDVIRLLQARFKFQHNDLGFRNIMVKDNHIKLIDFAFSRMIVDGKLYTIEKKMGVDTELNFRTLKREKRRYVPPEDSDNSNSNNSNQEGGRRRRRTIKKRSKKSKKSRRRI